jgi:two-component system, chemotaxis family, chemotaxis protein CheY
VAIAVGKRVLIVDDANFIRVLLRSVLVPNGFEIVGEAKNGTEAVQLYRRLKPDVVTLDITMQEKDGLQAAREILIVDPEARIVMVSALGQRQLLIDAARVGIKDFVLKPFSPARILSAVHRATR